MQYVNTKDQLADFLTKGAFTSIAWSALCKLASIGPSWIPPETKANSPKTLDERKEVPDPKAKSALKPGVRPAICSVGLAQQLQNKDSLPPSRFGSSQAGAIPALASAAFAKASATQNFPFAFVATMSHGGSGKSYQQGNFSAPPPVTRAGQTRAQAAANLVRQRSQTERDIMKAAGISAAPKASTPPRSASAP